MILLTEITIANILCYTAFGLSGVGIFMFAFAVGMLLKNL